MIGFIEYLSDRLTDTNDYLAKGIGWLSGFGAMIYFIFMKVDVTIMFSWVGAINTLLVFATSAITTIVVLIATDLYKYAKPKTVFFLKSKLKCLRNGNSKKISQKKRA